MKVELYANTNGKGQWSTKAAETCVNQVKLREIYVHGEDEVNIYIEAKLTPASWNTNRDGLVYTDELWIKEFRLGLIDLGVAPKVAKTIDYTEQGMQGKNYVSLQTGTLSFAETEALFDALEHVYGPRWMKTFAVE